MKKKSLTGERLLELGVLNQQQLDTCVSAQLLSRQIGRPLQIGEIIVQYGYASRQVVEDAIRYTGNLASGFTAIELPFSVCRAFQVMPLGIKDGVLFVASRSILYQRDCDEIMGAAIESGYPVSSVQNVPRNSADILSYISSLPGVDSGVLQGEIDHFFKLISSGNDKASGELLQTIINHLFIDAIQQGASDVHISSAKEDIHCRIRYRLDGNLFDKYMMSTECMRRLVTQIKKRSVPDASEKLRPQGGRMSIAHRGRNIDLRVESGSNDEGEDIVVRLLDSSRTASLDVTFAEQPELLRLFKGLADIRGKHGELIIVAGPTGQGKSSTIAALLYEMPRERIRVDTAEDPVENRIPGVCQHQVNDLIGLSYSVVLKSSMRKDPNVLSVGEVRDSETAEQCVRMTETGHCVITTLHTTSVPETLARLISILPDNYRDMGTFAIGKTIRAILNQRLVRRVCKCHKRVPVKELIKGSSPALSVANILQMNDDDMIAVPVGCELCNHTGYKGRVIAPEAVFFPSDAATRVEIQRILFEKGAIGQLLHLDGVRYFSREETVRNLVVSGVIDIESAIDALHLGVLEMQ